MSNVTSFVYQSHLQADLAVQFSASKLLTLNWQFDSTKFDEPVFKMKGRTSSQCKARIPTSARIPLEHNTQQACST